MSDNSAKGLMAEMRRDWMDEIIHPYWTRRTLFGKIVYFPFMMLVAVAAIMLYLGCAVVAGLTKLGQFTKKKEFRDEV